MREVLVSSCLVSRQVPRLRRDPRSALLASKRAMDSKVSSNREELVWSSALKQTKSPGGNSFNQSGSLKIRSFDHREVAVMNAQAGGTDALRRTMALMQSELERSVLSTQMLSECVSYWPPDLFVQRHLPLHSRLLINSRRAYWLSRHFEAACHSAREGRLARLVTDIRSPHTLSACVFLHSETAHRRSWAAYCGLVDTLLALHGPR